LGESGQYGAWVGPTLRLVAILSGLLGSFLGGEHRGEVAAFSRALGNAEKAVAEQIEGQTFRALEAEAARDDRVPASVVSHLARVIADLDRDVQDCQRRGNP
jgi:hypothetical protein